MDNSGTIINEIRGFELFADGKMATIPFIYLPSYIPTLSLTGRSSSGIPGSAGPPLV